MSPSDSSGIRVLDLRLVQSFMTPNRMSSQQALPLIFNWSVTAATGETYATADLILRPARVAVMFPGGEDWRAHARTAITAVGNYWGGSGFIVVPYATDGSVSPALMAAVAAYDPDHVVVLRMPRADPERRMRNQTSLSSIDNEAADTAPPVSWARFAAPAATRARDLVAAQCTPFKQAFPGDDDPRETITHIDFEASQRRGWLVPASREPDSECLAVSKSWSSDSALSLAIRTGIHPYEREATVASNRAEPAQSQLIRAAFTPWIGELPQAIAAALSINGGTPNDPARWWFDEQSAGLVHVRHRFSGEGGAIVVGGEAEDFALAYAYERLLGFGVWLGPEMLSDQDLRPTVRSALRHAAERVEGQGERLMITSASCETEELALWSEDLKTEMWDTNPLNVAATGTIGRVKELPGGMAIGTPKLSAGLHQLVIEDPFAPSLSVPVFTDHQGTLHMRAPMATPTPAKLLVQQDGLSKPYWYVSVDFSEASMPRGRGIPQQFVEFDLRRYGNYSVRSGRDGLSYHSQAGGLILAGTSLTSQVYKPKLKVLGMQPWVAAMATRANLDAIPSVPGMHAELISRRLGGRTALVSMVSGNYHPALQIFASTRTTTSAQRSDEVFPLRDGVVLGNEPYPSFDALDRVLPGINTEKIRRWIDQLAQADLLWRGFVLDCTECGRPSFVRLDHLGQRFECSRCLAMNELAAPRWRTSTNEPPWFYDLHPVFRELMATHGDVGLFAAQILRQGAREYADTAELEFRRQGSHRRLAEIDLIAHVDGEVVIVEAKSNGRLGSTQAEARRAAKKKMDIAVAIRADKVVLATSAPEVAAHGMELLRSAAYEAGVPRISIEKLTSLGPILTEPAPSPEPVED